MNEKQLAPRIGEAVEKQYSYYKFVKANVSLGRRALKRYWQEWFGNEVPPTRPEIDILLFDKPLKEVLAIELKYISGSSTVPYYAGIDQALALLRFGFGSVQVWHCFTVDSTDAEIAKHIQEANALVGRLDLPLSYAGLKVIEEENTFTFKSVSRRIYAEPPLVEEEGPPDPRRGRKTNPFADDSDAKRIREFIFHVFNLPQQ